jgi:hypothetical protein
VATAQMAAAIRSVALLSTEGEAPIFQKSMREKDKIDQPIRGLEKRFTGQVNVLEQGAQPDECEYRKRLLRIIIMAVALHKKQVDGFYSLSQRKRANCCSMASSMR